MFCQKCGHENSTAADFCSACGNSLSQLPPPLTAAYISNYAPPNTLSNPNHSEHLGQVDTLLATFVGDKYTSYYREKWFKDREPSLQLPEKGTNIQSFNIAALLLGVLWLCYRKMYKVAFILMGAVTLIDIALMYLLEPSTYSKIGNLTFAIGPAVLLALMGNHLYQKHASQQIQKITGLVTDPMTVQQQLVKQGGTTWLGAIAGTLLLFAMIGVLYYLLAPSWFWDVA